MFDSVVILFKRGNIKMLDIVICLDSYLNELFYGLCMLKSVV